MRAIFTFIILNLILIPVLWLLPIGYKVHIYTITAVADGFTYLILSACFFFDLHRSSPVIPPGMTLRFVLLQLLLLFSLFLFKLSSLLLLKHCI